MAAGGKRFVGFGRKKPSIAYCTEIKENMESTTGKQHRTVSTEYASN